jgi:hypothetical protein
MSNPEPGNQFQNYIYGVKYVRLRSTSMEYMESSAMESITWATRIHHRRAHRFNYSEAQGIKSENNAQAQKLMILESTKEHVGSNPCAQRFNSWQVYVDSIQLQGHDDSALVAYEVIFRKMWSQHLGHIQYCGARRFRCRRTWGQFQESWIILRVNGLESRTKYTVESTPWAYGVIYKWTWILPPAHKDSTVRTTGVQGFNYRSTSVQVPLQENKISTPGSKGYSLGHKILLQGHKSSAPGVQEFNSGITKVQIREHKGAGLQGFDSSRALDLNFRLVCKKMLAAMHSFLFFLSLFFMEKKSLLYLISSAAPQRSP